MAIALHPYISGVPHRIGALDAALEYICRHDGVWRATGAEIAEHFLAQSKTLREHPMKLTGDCGAAAVAVLCVAAFAAPDARAAETIVVGSVGSASANLWPVTIGVKKGFFAAEDIKIDLVFVQSNAGVIQQLAVDAVNVSVGSGLVDPIRAIDKGAPLAIARIEMQRPPYALLAKPAIKSIKELKGKIVSVGGAEGHHPHLLRAHAGAERRRPQGRRPDLCGRDLGAAGGAAVGRGRRRDPDGAL